eukprot:jgi/Hompol1/4341/HPOL_003604-RA
MSLAHSLAQAELLAGNSDAHEELKRPAFAATLIARLEYIYANTATIADVSTDEGSPIAWLEKLTADQLKSRYARACLDCIVNIQQALSADELSSIDSIRSRNAVEALLPIIICWGMAPALEPGAASMLAHQFITPGSTTKSSGLDAAVPTQELQRAWTRFWDFCRGPLVVLVAQYGSPRLRVLISH